jgi:hypothetical protein
VRRLLHTFWASRVALPVVLALVVVGSTFAYFRAEGSIAQSSSAGVAQPVTLSGATPGAQVAPGASADVKLTASNPNSFEAHVPSLELDTSLGSDGFAVDAEHSTCDLSTLSFTTQSVGWIVPPKVGATNGTLTIDLANAISMDSDAANACQGATFTVYLKVGP